LQHRYCGCQKVWALTAGTPGWGGVNHAYSRSGLTVQPNRVSGSRSILLKSFCMVGVLQIFRFWRPCLPLRQERGHL